MIRSKLPPIIDCKDDQDSVTWTLEIAADLEFFSGHFPEQPVLPGVTQLDWAIKLGCKHFGYPVNIATLEVLKFQQLMLPDSRVELTISHNPAKAKLMFAYSDGDKRFASGRIALNSEATQVINSADSN